MLDVAHGLEAAGRSPTFALMRAEGDFLPEASASFPVVDLGCPRARQMPRALARYLREKRPDALLVAMWPLTVIVPLVARLSGFRGPIAVSEHGILSAQYSGWGRLHRLALRSSMMLGYRSASARIGVSQGVAADMAMLAGLPAGAIRVINNPVRNLQCPTHEQLAEAERLWCSGGPRLLTVGSLKPVKNHALLLRAFATLQPRDAKLMLLGQGQTEPVLRELVRELGVEDRVIFAGFHADPTPFYMTADRFILSSNSEGFGNVLVEALSCGLPVISTDCPTGPSEILAGGRFGNLARVGDANSLADAIHASLAAQPDRQLLKDRAAEFSLDIAAAKYLSALGMQ